jgi:carbon monoxide dehydrogenase subunit G
MDMQGTRLLPVSQELAWAALNDPDVLKACIPGCDRFEATGPNAYAVGAAVKIGPVSAKFNGKVMLSEIVPPEHYRLSFEAQGGVAGFSKGHSQVVLKPTGETCELQYTVSSSVGGKIAQIGQRLVDGAAKSMAEDFFQRFEQELLGRHPHAQPVASPGRDEAPDAYAADHPPGRWPVWAMSGAAFGVTFVIALAAFFVAAWGQ